MTSRSVLLDTSALLTLIEDEDGAARVEQVLRDEPAIIAAYAAYHQATLLHKDPQFEALASELDVEALPYKTTRS